MKLVRLIAKPNGHYKEGTQVFNHDGDRFTLEEWNTWVIVGSVLVRGINQDGKMDGELSDVEEFDVFIDDVDDDSPLNERRTGADDESE